MDPGRRLPEGPTESVKTKGAKYCVCLKLWALPYPRRNSPRDKGYRSLSCPTDGFFWSHSIHALSLPPSPWLCPKLLGCLCYWVMEPVFWSTELRSPLVLRDFLKLRAVCGTWNCVHSHFMQSNNSIRCCRNLILMIISICNSPSLNKCLHWRGISVEKVNLFESVNFL